MFNRMMGSVPGGVQVAHHGRETVTLTSQLQFQLGDHLHLDPRLGG